MQKSTYLCPYCFTEHKRRDLWFRCRNKRCKLSPDKELAAYTGRAPELRQVCFPYYSGIWFSKREQARCPECQELTSTIICPKCHNTLPEITKKGSNLIISAVGAMDAGKSSYLAVLIRELKRHIALQLNGVAAFMDDMSAREYEERFLRYLYPNIGTDPSLRIPKTKSCFCGNTFISANRPILVNCKFFKKRKKREENVNHTVVFYDAAGEDFEEEEMMFTMSSNLIHSDAILFFLDPLKIPYVRNSLRRDVVNGAATSKLHSGSSADEILLRMSKLIRAKKGLSEEEKIDIPIAVIIPKLDILEPLLPEYSVLLKESLHLKQGGFVLQEGFDVHEELVALLCEWGEIELLSHLQADFHTFQFFSVSAFGNNPDMYGRLQCPKPVRVEDPFLWVLSENKVIDSI